MNAEDRRRMVDLDRRRDAAIESLPNGGTVTVVIRVGRDGHVCRRESSLRIELFPLDRRTDVERS